MEIMSLHYLMGILCLSTKMMGDQDTEMTQKDLIEILSTTKLPCFAWSVYHCEIKPVTWGLGAKCNWEHWTQWLSFSRCCNLPVSCTRWDLGAPRTWSQQLFFSLDQPHHSEGKTLPCVDHTEPMHWPSWAPWLFSQQGTQSDQHIKHEPCEVMRNCKEKARL